IDDVNLLAGRLATVLLTFTLFPSLGWLLLFIWTIHFVKLINRAVRKFRQQYHATPSAFDLFNQCRHAHHNEPRCGTKCSVTSALLQRYSFTISQPNSY
ncbi:hypothetical protein Golob_004936, partial [Gossypium lobatum]|nr:hypothetical protein [Gossypium lobatum]